MSAPLLLRESHGSLVVLTLNRPERRNALSRAMLAALLQELEEVAQDRLTRVLILAASGPVFCAGHDLQEMTGRSVVEYRDIFDACTLVMQKLQAMPQPVIAAVQGMATAAGFQLVVSCDLVVASETATFACPGVKIGLFCSTPMVPLTRTIGPKRAMEMLLTGRAIDAATAAQWGLVNRVVTPDEVLPTARALGLQIAEASVDTISLGKQAFYAQLALTQDQAYAYAKEVMTVNALAPDAQEGISAFLEKRVPCWVSNARVDK